MEIEKRSHGVEQFVKDLLESFKNGEEYINGAARRQGAAFVWKTAKEDVPVEVEEKKEVVVEETPKEEKKTTRKRRTTKKTVDK